MFLRKYAPKYLLPLVRLLDLQLHQRAPGGYPSIYQGCHWGDCSSGGLTTTPVQASNLSAGKVTTSWSTTQPGGSNDYDVAYDIWFNRTSTTTTGQPNCLSSTAGRAASRPRSR